MSTMRGFRYALEPLRQQREWKLQAAQARAASLQAQLATCEARIAQLETHCAHEASVAAHAWQKLRDPASKSAALAYLAGLQRDGKMAAGEARALREELAQARRDCAARQRDFEALEQHRDQALREHRHDTERRAAMQADADWCLRAQPGDAA